MGIPSLKKHMIMSMLTRALPKDIKSQCSEVVLVTAAGVITGVPVMTNESLPLSEYAQKF